MQTQRQEWWFEEVDALVDRLIEDKAGLREQEEAWDFIGQGCGPEALATAKKMFAERSASRPKEEEEAKDEGPEEDDGGDAVILSKASPL